MADKNIVFILTLLVVCVALFVSRKVRPDFVALGALAAISVSGILTFEEALSGFGEPMILMIALMLVISEGFSRTGISYRVGEWIYKKSGRNTAKAISLLMVAVAILGSTMSTTAIIAIFLPITLGLCRRLNLPPAKLLMPLAFAGIISGMMTLIATTPNMIMSGLIENTGHKGFGFFCITPIGLIVLAMSVAYMLYAYKFLGNSKTSNVRQKTRQTLGDFVRDYNLKGREFIFRVRKNSPLAGKKLRDLNLRSAHEINIICVERKSSGKKSELINPTPETVVSANDILYVDMPYAPKYPDDVKSALGVEIDLLHGENLLDKSMQIGMAEISVQPESEYIGKSLSEIDFRKTFGLHAIGIRRNRRPLHTDISQVRLKVGDLLLIVGPQNLIRRLFSNEIAFMVVNIPAELSDMATAPDKAPYALLSMAAMILLMVFNIVPNALAALIACIMMILFKCLSVEAAYKSIKLPTIVLIASMMPFAMALEKTGTLKIASDALFALCGNGGPHAVLAGLFALTMFTGLFMSNTITTLLVGPLAIGAAATMGVSPYPFAMTVAVAASTAFMSPLSTSVNLLVWEPGNYGFGDFMKIGLPFSLAVMAVSVFIIPLLFPF